MMRFLYIVLALFLLVSCSDYGKIYKSKNATLKYNKAVQLYMKKDYARALPLFEQLRDIYGRATDSLEQVYFYTAYSHYGLGDYEFASMFFKDFTENFTSSKRSIECAYMAVYCDYMDIGSHELDQSQTIKTIGGLQTFINYYPESEYAQRCNNHIDDLRRKLQLKEYGHVKQYFLMGDFRAAVNSAKNTLKLYPDMEKKEELEFLIIKAQFSYAANSIEKKRLERYKEVLDYYQDYTYSNGSKGEHAKEAEAIYNKAKEAIEKLKTLL
jgi:outer membrane protein assembly factor BamD